MEVLNASLLETFASSDDGPPDSAASKPKEVDLFHVFPSKKFPPHRHLFHQGVEVEKGKFLPNMGLRYGLPWLAKK